VVRKPLKIFGGSFLKTEVNTLNSGRENLRATKNGYCLQLGYVPHTGAREVAVPERRRNLFRFFACHSTPDSCILRETLQGDLLREHAPHSASMVRSVVHLLQM
jgi:hypothetical protein